MRREDLTGTWAMEREAEWPSKRREEIAQQAFEYGLDSASSIRDRSISLFDRGFESFYSGERFMGAPFDELYPNYPFSVQVGNMNKRDHTV